MRRQLRDPEMRRKVWPDYTFGCKRVLFSSHFLPALAASRRRARHRPDHRDHAERHPHRRRHPARGRLHHLGHGLSDERLHVPDGDRPGSGRSCRRRVGGGAHAHLGIAVPGFPSLFVMYGPNTNTSGGSIVFYLEAQAAYIRQALQRVRDAGVDAIAVRPEVEARERPRHPGAVRRHRLDASATPGTGTRRAGSSTNWPGYMREYAELTDRLDPTSTS